MKELSVIQKTYDCLKWYGPLIERIPRKHKFSLGVRIINRLYDLLEGLIEVKYQKEKLAQLKQLNIHIDIIRYQTRLLLDFELISVKKFEHAQKLISAAPYRDRVVHHALCNIIPIFERTFISDSYANRVGTHNPTDLIW